MGRYRDIISPELPKLSSSDFEELNKMVSKLLEDAKNLYCHPKNISTERLLKLYFTKDAYRRAKANWKVLGDSICEVCDKLAQTCERYTVPQECVDRWNEYIERVKEIYAFLRNSVSF